MRKGVVLIAAVLLLAFSAMAQNYPKYEIFAGYSYLHGDTGGSGISLNLNGWNAQLSYNVKHWVGLTADFDGHYGTPVGVSFNLHNFLFGPTLSHRGKTWTPYAHALFGASRAGGDITPVTSFAVALGGGLDAKVHKNIAFRVVQADYLLTTFDPGVTSAGSFRLDPGVPTINNRQNNFRFSTGFVFRFQ